MNLKMNFGEQTVNFYLPKPAHTDWIVGTYFKEFQIKMEASIIKNEAHLEAIKSALNETFKDIAKEAILHEEDGQVILTFGYEESVGPVVEEYFSTLTRIYGNWLVQKMKMVTICRELSYELDIHFQHVYAYSNFIKAIETEDKISPSFMTMIEGQPLNIHFNTNDDFNSHCYVDQYAVKMDVSHLSNSELRQMKEDLLSRFKKNVKCVLGSDDGELIYVIKPKPEIMFFKNIHEFHSILADLMDSWKKVLSSIQEQQESESSLDLFINDQQIPYILEISITNRD